MFNYVLHYWLWIFIGIIIFGNKKLYFLFIQSLYFTCINYIKLLTIIIANIFHVSHDKWLKLFPYAFVITNKKPKINNKIYLAYIMNKVFTIEFLRENVYFKNYNWSWAIWNNVEINLFFIVAFNCNEYYYYSLKHLLYLIQ